MSLTAPPVGARVRHTTVYSRGTTVTIEGTVVLGMSLNQMADPRIYIGDDADQLVAYLVDRPGEYTVAIEVLETPHPAEPPSGTELPAAPVPERQETFEDAREHVFHDLDEEDDDGPF